MKRAVLLICFVCAASCAVPDESTRAKAEDEIREVTFRYQFLHNASGLQQNAKIYFLAIADEHGDPTDEFMERFADDKPTVKKKSQAKVGGDGVKDRDTGEIGLIFRVDNIKWVSDTEVEVGGGYYEAGLSSSGNTYFLKKQKDRWVVTKDVTHWIS